MLFVLLAEALENFMVLLGARQVVQVVRILLAIEKARVNIA